jgi:hypothetical protein
MDSGTVAALYEVFSKTILALFRSFYQFLIIITAPWRSCYTSMQIILSTDDHVEREILTIGWRDSKLAELTYVSISVSFELEDAGIRLWRGR